jgi:L-2-hydroxyglutarate oxidase
MSWYEIRRSISRGEFCRSLQKLVPSITPVDLDHGGAGVRAQAMFPDGSLVEDFHISVDRGSMHVLNAPSPAATASLAIGEEIAPRLLQAFTF